jgi:hypothetical protein
MKFQIKIYRVFLWVFAAFPAGANDSIIVHKDPRLDVLSLKQMQINKRTAMMTSTGLYKGFRIQVLSTNKREDAFNTKTILLANFPDQKSYVLYQSPNFKVRIGNFLKSDEAESLKKQLALLFKQGVYIVADAIEYTPPDDEQFSPQ